MRNRLQRAVAVAAEQRGKILELGRSLTASRSRWTSIPLKWELRTTRAAQARVDDRRRETEDGSGDLGQPDQLIAVAQGARVVAPFCTAKALRCAPVAFPHALLGKGPAAVGVHVGVIEESPFERVHLECVSELVQIASRIQFETE